MDSEHLLNESSRRRHIENNVGIAERMSFRELRGAPGLEVV